MPDNRLSKQIGKCQPPERHKKGSPKTNWNQGITKAMSARNLIEEDCQNGKRQRRNNGREAWKRGIGQCRKTF